MPFANEEKIVKGHLSFVDGLSDGEKMQKHPFSPFLFVCNFKFHINICILTVLKECCDLIQKCLIENPECQPTFKEILDHKWFEEELQDTTGLVTEEADDQPLRTGRTH